MPHLLALLMMIVSAHAAGIPQVGSIEAIVGSGSVTLTRGGKATQVQRRGNSKLELFERDVIETGESVAVRILYKDGSRQLLAAKSCVRLFIRDGVPAPEFIEGAVLSQVTPSPKPSGKPRFLFRTKSVVLGVRGTEFVVHTGPKGLEVHTLKGVVEAVRDEHDFGTAKGIQIKEAFEIVGIAGNQIPAPSAFVPAEFLGKVAEKYPELGKLLKEN
jgi:hypothetical protein